MNRNGVGRRRFSFQRLADAIVPRSESLTQSNVLADELPVHRRDMLYGHQLASKVFHALDEYSIFVAGVASTERISKNTYRALQKNGVLDAEGLVNTAKIGPGFLHQVAILNATRQRELINMLFWWEEESRRHNKLWDEYQELTKMIADAESSLSEHTRDSARKEMVDQLKFARERVKMKIRQRPSQRREDIESDTDNIMDHFRGRAASAPLQISSPHGSEGLHYGHLVPGDHDRPVTDAAELPKYSK